MFKGTGTSMVLGAIMSEIRRTIKGISKGGGTIAFSIGGGVLGQTIIPIPVLGAFLGSVAGGLFG